MNKTIKSDYPLLQDAYLGNRQQIQSKLNFLSKLAQAEEWNYPGREGNQILFSYLCHTYEKVKQEEKLALSDDGMAMCFNTGLMTDNGSDIFAYFVPNQSLYAKTNQEWYLQGFKQKTDKEMRVFASYPDIADYFTQPSDFIFDRAYVIDIDYDHIIDDNFERFASIGLSDKYMIQGLLENSVKRIINNVKRNYKLALPQYYTDKHTGESKIQLLLPLFLKRKDSADLALVVDKGDFSYIGKTIIPLDWAYTNSRRILKPDVDWIKI